MIYSAIKTRGNIKQCNCSDMKLIVIHNKVLVHKYVVLFTFPEFGNRTRRQKYFFGTILQLWNDPASQVLYRLFIISSCIFRDENVMYKPPKTEWDPLPSWLSRLLPLEGSFRYPHTLYHCESGYTLRLCEIDFKMLYASSPKIIQALVCPEHAYARHFWLTVEMPISLVNLKLHRDQLVRRDHKVFYALRPDTLSRCSISSLLPMHPSSEDLSYHHLYYHYY